MLNFNDVNDALNYVKNERGIEDWKYYKTIYYLDDYHHLYNDKDNLINAIRIRKDDDEYLITIFYNIMYLYIKEDYWYEDYDSIGIKKLGYGYKIRFLGE